jgi:DNA-binding transcriptional ArsR family regulator
MLRHAVPPVQRNKQLSARLADESEAAPVFAALGDSTRLALVARLRAGKPQSIAQLALGLPVTRQAVTKHLHVLSQAGLVRDFRRGRERLWQPEAKCLDDAPTCTGSRGAGTRRSRGCGSTWRSSTM